MAVRRRRNKRDEGKVREGKGFERERERDEGKGRERKGFEREREI